MTSVDQFSDDGRTNESCSSGDKNTHIHFLLTFVNAADRDDRDEALTPPGSRVETFAEINLHSRTEVGRVSISINSCNQSSVESSACPGPNNWVTALKNADNSRSAITVRSEQRWLEGADGL